MMIDEELLGEFLVEAQESLDLLDQEMIVLEANPHDREVINSIFRRVHTIKGTSGFLEFHKLEAITHAGESLLDSVRAGRVALSAEVATALLKLFDAMRRILGQVANSGAEGNESFDSLVSLLQVLNHGGANQSVAELSHEVTRPTPAAEIEPNEELLRELYADPAFGEAVAGKSAVGSAEQDDRPEPTRDASASSALIEAGGTESSEHSDSAEVLPTTGGIPAVPQTETSLRVDVGLLDQLMNLVGELVLARNQILQFTKLTTDANFTSTTQRLNLITSELQEGVMRTRMQPVANVWNKFPRVVRDVAKLCGKRVSLEMEGKDTELDKTILEAIKDPLTHIVRNAVDHGIESPEVRARGGKNPDGKLSLKAYHEGGQVVLEIADDGAGLNVDRIRAKAIERGLISSERAAQMGVSDIQRLIFAPGFSTAEQVTNLSGRGVGMDVVRSNIERIGGKVDISSEQGKGTAIQIRIPLTLAIVPALLVTTQQQRFAIPQASLVELVRITGSKIRESLEEISGAHFFRLRGKLLPLVFLERVLEIGSPSVLAAGEDLDEQALNIVVVKADGSFFGVIVDCVHDTEEIVVKPLGKALKNVSVYAGATIMGDGKVALILDVPGIARRASVLSQRSNSEQQASRAHADERAELKQKLLLVSVGGNSRLAMPLSDVHRLEEFESSVIERASGQDVVQYRDSILPLIDLNAYLRLAPPVEIQEKRRVVVFQSEERAVGLVVSQVLDIVEEAIELQAKSSRPGIIGSAIVQKRVTDVLDLDRVISDGLHAISA